MVDASNPLIVSTNEACLHRSDLETLKDDEWLGDNVLAFHAEWLDALSGQPGSAGASSSSQVKMFPPSVVEVLCTLGDAPASDVAQVVPKPSQRYVLLPVSDRYSPSGRGHNSIGSHWSLIVVEASTGKGYHLDSMGDCNRTAANAVHESILKLVDPHKPKKSYLEPKKTDCLQHQENGSDCGIYVLLLSSLLHRELNSSSSGSPDLKKIVKSVCKDATPDHVARFRRAYLDWLVMWGKITHHEEHVDPSQQVKRQFVGLFSEVGVEA